MNEASFVGISDRFWDRPPQSLDNFIPKELPEVTLIWFLAKYILHSFCERRELNANLLQGPVFLGVVDEAEEDRLVVVEEVFCELVAFNDAAVNSVECFGRREEVPVSLARGCIDPVEVLLAVDCHESIFDFLSKCSENLLEARISLRSLVVAVGLLEPQRQLRLLLRCAYLWNTLYGQLCLIVCVICLNVLVALAKCVANGVLRCDWVSSLLLSRGVPLDVLGLKVGHLTIAIVQKWIVTRRLTVVQRSYLDALVNAVV